MATQVIEHPAEVRCYACGKPEIVGICHHCGRPVCKEHMRQATSTATGPSTLEFAELGLASTKCGELPIHCLEHGHIVVRPSRRTLVWGILIAVAGLLIAILQISQDVGSPLVGFGILLVGAAVGAAGYLNYNKVSQQNAGMRPDLPVLPHFEPTRVRETLRGDIQLDTAGTYTVTPSPATGSLSIAANFGRSERERLENYLKKFNVADGRGLQFQAGFALLKGAAGVVLRDASNATGDGHVIRLTGPVESQSILSGAGGRGASEWGQAKEYRLLSPWSELTAEDFPVHLAPSLAPNSAKRTLDLEVLWRNPAPELQLQRIELLELSVPAPWGFPRTRPEGAMVSNIAGVDENSQGREIISWRRVDVRDDEAQHRKTFMLQFENEIQTADAIEGRIEVTFRGALSQLHSVELFTPLGGPVKEDHTEIETRVVATFRLELLGLRYQDTRVVPDSEKPADSGRESAFTFAGVVPDHETVIALTNAISSANYYVQRVIESPPRTGQRANTVNRYWDIAGRKYIGVYPIDFHLVLSGEAVYGGEIRAVAGTTKTELTVKGVYSNAEMEEQIEGAWEQLAAVNKATLPPLAKQPPAAPPKAEEPPREVVADLANKAPAPIREAAPAPAAVSKSEQRAKLEERLEKLTDRLAEGHITEAMYDKLAAQIQASLAALEQTA